MIEIGPTEEVTRPGMHAFSDLFTRSSTFIKQSKKFRLLIKLFAVRLII